MGISFPCASAVQEAPPPSLGGEHLLQNHLSQLEQYEQFSPTMIGVGQPLHLNGLPAQGFAVLSPA